MKVLRLLIGVLNFRVNFNCKIYKSPIMPNKKKKNQESNLQQVKESDLDPNLLLSYFSSQFETNESIKDALKRIETSHIENVTELKSAVQNLLKRVKHLENENKILNQKVESMAITEVNLNKQINELQQDKLNCHLEISGIPPTLANSTENPKVVAEKALKTCNISIDDSQILRAYKRIVNINSEPTTIVTAVFKDYDEKLRVMRQKRVENKNGSIFLNHALTQANRSLFIQSKKLCKDSKFYAFIANGQIYVKKESELQGLKIKSQDDLKKFVHMKIQQRSSSPEE